MPSPTGSWNRMCTTVRRRWRPPATDTSPTRRSCSASGLAIAAGALLALVRRSARGCDGAPVCDWTLALLPPAGFVVQEHLERLFATGDVPALVAEPVFLVGLLCSFPSRSPCSPGHACSPGRRWRSAVRSELRLAPGLAGAIARRALRPSTSFALCASLPVAQAFARLPSLARRARAPRANPRETRR